LHRGLAAPRSEAVHMIQCRRRLGGGEGEEAENIEDESRLHTSEDVLAETVRCAHAELILMPERMREGAEK